ncbi:hypothetical protein D3C85_1878440 [compost metagenome]
MPGTYWPVRVTSASGRPMLMIACQLHSGVMKTGWATAMVIEPLLSSPNEAATAQPTISTDRIA